MNIRKITTRKGEPRWRLEWYDGPRRRRKFWKTRHEAEDAGDLVKKPGWVLPEKIPRLEAVAKTYLEGMKGLHPGSVINAGRVYRKHLQPRFGPMRLDQITIPAIETWARGLELESGTLKNILGLGSRIVKEAIRLQVFQGINPFELAKRPRAEFKEVTDADGDHDSIVVTKREVLTAAEVQRIIACAEPEWRTLFVLFAGSGLRRGEAMALKRSDIVFEANGTAIVAVNKSLSRVAGVGRIFKPKTRNANRRIVVEPAVALALKKWLLQHTHQTVFPAPDGNYWLSDQPLKAYKRAAALAKPEPGRDLRLHGMRHYHLSALLSQGANFLWVSKRAGHSSPAVTLNVYSHWIEPESEPPLIPTVTFGHLLDTTSAISTPAAS